MSDRMPEDLPVTKRIDVMVGITRSKVILDVGSRQSVVHWPVCATRDLFIAIYIILCMYIYIYVCMYSTFYIYIHAVYSSGYSEALSPATSSGHPWAKTDAEWTAQLGWFDVSPNRWRENQGRKKGIPPPEKINHGLYPEKRRISPNKNIGLWSVSCLNMQFCWYFQAACPFSDP